MDDKQLLDLKDFVAETLVAIVAGVHCAQERVEKTGAQINPPDTHVEDGRVTRPKKSGGASRPEFGTLVEFDIAITVARTTDAQGQVGVGVVAAGLGLSGQVESNVQNNTASRVRFKVPLFLPSARAECDTANDK